MHVEIANRFVKLHQSFTHSGLAHATLWQMEFFVEIMCALANAHEYWRKDSSHKVRTDILDLQVHIERAHYFSQLMSRSPSSLETFLHPAHTVAPDSDRAEAWKCALDSIPHTKHCDASINCVLTHRAVELLRRTSSDKYGSPLFDYGRATWTHKFPDERAKHLCLAHYVLLLEFAIAPLVESSRLIYVQATIHPSQRNHLIHYALISYRLVPVTPSVESFELHSSGCSCEGGYACLLADAVSSSDRRAGTCSHVQALLRSLFVAKESSTKVVCTHGS